MRTGWEDGVEREIARMDADMIALARRKCAEHGVLSPPRRA